MRQVCPPDDIQPAVATEAAPTVTGRHEEYLSVAQLSGRLPYTVKSIRNMMCQGVFREGIHYTRLTGRPIFLWSRVEALLHERMHGEACRD